MFTPNIIPTKHAEPAELTRNDYEKKVSFPLNGKNKKKIYFLSVNTKNNSSHVLKISGCYALVKFLIVSIHSMKCIWYSSQKRKYPLYICAKFREIISNGIKVIERTRMMNR